MTRNKAPRKWWLVIPLLVIVCGVGAWYALRSSNTPAVEMDTVSAMIGDTSFTLYRPTGTEQLTTGLGAFSSLPPDRGMIFLDLPEGVQSMWMKNMKFDIDMVWVGRDDRVIHIVQDVSKDSYPKIFQNPAARPSKYVIELPAGSCEKHNINPDTPVRIT